MPKPAKIEEPQEPIGPAVVTPLHVRDRVLSATAGAGIGWRLTTRVANIAARGYLDGGNPKYTKHERLEAAAEYSTLIATNARGSTDSTQKLNTSRSTGGGDCGAAAIDAGNKLSALSRQLGAMDREILRLVFECGYWPADAVREATGDYADTRPARFRETLDALLGAMAFVRKNGWRRVAGGLL